MTTTNNQIEEIKKTLKAKAERMAPTAIGQRYSIRENKNTVQHGTISACEFERIAWHGRQAVAIFKVVLENGGLHFGPYHVSRIPATPGVRF
jgi:hypothetical protein